jgi:tetratricopeptide (TPR) repeat protein
MRGKVVDGQGKPVPDAVVVFEATDANRRTQTKTDKNGDFLQVGLSSGSYKVTASKDGVGTQTLTANVRQGQNNPLNFTISAASGVSAADKEAAAALQAAAGAAVEAMKAGRHDEAIAKFNEVLAKLPTCADCYLNIGQASVAKQDYAQAETAF